MIRQVVLLPEWRVLQTVLANSVKLPLFDKSFSRLMSTAPKEDIVNFLNCNSETTCPIRLRINAMFSEIYLPKNKLELSEFLIDLKRLSDNPDIHNCVVLDISLLHHDSLGHFFQIVDRLRSDISLVLICNDHTDETSNYVLESMTSVSYIACLTFLNDDLHCLLRSYQKGALQLQNKLFKLTHNEHAQKYEVHVLPTYIDDESASQAFVEAHAYHPIHSLSKLLDHLDATPKAVVVLTCHSFSDIPSTSSAALDIKKRYGKDVKVLIKEKVPCIRYNDFHMLVACGVQCVIEATRTESYLNDQIVLAYKTEIQSPTHTFEALLAQYQSPLHLCGELNSEDFKKNVVECVKHVQYSQIEFALVELTPYSSLSIMECMKYCQVKRTGDIVCRVDGRILVFFSTLRIYEVEQALNNVFSVAVDELFISKKVFVEGSNILKLLTSLNFQFSLEKSVSISKDEKVALPKPLRKYAKRIEWSKS